MFLKSSSLFIKGIFIIGLPAIMLSLSIVSCGQDPSQSGKDKISYQGQKELLIYCGATMIRPMAELSKIIENQENCKITITKGGSGNLLKSIIYNKTGDLYLPGSDKYYRIIDEKYPGLVTATESVGQNKAVIMVQKGNPENITGDLSNFMNKYLGVVIGCPESGSIGEETKQILVKQGIYKEVIKNVIKLTTDSKDLVKVIRNNEADMVINWFAAFTWDDNAQYMDVIAINTKYAKKKKLILGLLKYSKHPDTAKKLMQLAASEKGKALFKKYGLYFD